MWPSDATVSWPRPGPCSWSWSARVGGWIESLTMATGGSWPVRKIPRLAPDGNPPPASKRRSLQPPVGLRVRRFLVAAMEQQMWFFGCDTTCADGNLLVRYGFKRYRLKGHRGETSRYRFHWRRSARVAAGCHDAVEDALVDLHGWCAGLHRGTCGGRGGFLYVRAGNRLGWYDAPQPPAPGEYDDDPDARGAFRLLGPRPERGFCRAAALFFAWVDDYESWIERTCGPDYRRRCHGRAPLPWLSPMEARGWLARYRQELSLATANPPENLAW